MTITVNIPDDIAGQIVAEGQEPARQALEDITVEAYRTHRITGAQLCRLLGIPSRHDMEEFLNKRGIGLDYTLEDFRREEEITAPLGVRRRQEIEAERRSNQPK